jgi:exosortase A
MNHRVNYSRSNYYKSNYLLVGFLCILAFWSLSFYQGITTAVTVWYSSEIYNHCFLVLPCVFFFIYQNKKRLLAQPISPNYWLIIPLIGLVFIQLFAQIGDIKLLMHLASFIALPLLVVFLLGNKASKEIAFPLFFVVFAIPLGDQLIPFLQELTTDLAVPLLELTHVPVYRSGLYLEIPEGRFLVAEACSGISFLITSIAFGFIYSYVSFSSLKKRFYFILLSFLVPVIANVLRVYGIILTGHLTDMQHAVGADHLIYGGIFYGIILFILILIGERFRDPSVANQSCEESVSQTVNKEEKKHTALAFIMLIALLGVQQFWLSYIDTSAPQMRPWPVNKILTSLEFKARTQQHLQPQLIDSTLVVEGQLANKHLAEMTNREVAVTFYAAYFDEVSGELISSQHRLYDDKYWTLVDQSVLQIADKKYNKLILTSQKGQQRMVYYWYLINGQSLISQTKAKLYQSYLKITGNNSAGHLLMLSSPLIDSSDPFNDVKIFLEQPEKLINIYYQQLNVRK